MEVVFYRFSKKVNSTKRPDTEGEPINAVYKDVCDINNPVINVTKDVSGMNYAKIGDSYFFIASIESIAHNLWRVTLNKDLLATYKTNILNTTAFVSRASEEYNKRIIDEFNIPLTEISRTVLQGNKGDTFYETGTGCYILETLNSLTGEVNSGFNSAYILTAGQMQQIASKLMADQDLLTELAKIFRSPIEAVVSCHWMPLSYDVVCAESGIPTNKVYLGSYDTGINAYLVGLNGMEFYDDFDLSPYLSDDYTDNSKYTEISLCIPYVGTVSIDTKQIAESIGESKVLRVRIAVDVRSGKQIAMIVPMEQPNAPINTYETIIFEDRPIGSSSPNFAPVLYASASAIPVMGMGRGWVAGSMSALGTSLIDSQRTIYSSVGTSGGSAFEYFGVSNRCIIVKRAKSYDVEDDNVKATIGLPVNRAMQLSTLHGFVQTINASVDMISLYNEYTTLNGLLNGGVYIE